MRSGRRWRRSCVAHDAAHQPCKQLLVLDCKRSNWQHRPIYKESTASQTGYRIKQLAMKRATLSSLAEKAYSKNIELSKSRYFEHLNLWVIVDTSPKQGFFQVYFETYKKYCCHPGQVSDTLWGFFPFWKDGVGTLNSRQLETLFGVLKDDCASTKAQRRRNEMGPEVSNPQEEELFESF